MLINSKKDLVWLEKLAPVCSCSVCTLQDPSTSQRGQTGVKDTNISQKPEHGFLIFKTKQTGQKREQSSLKECHTNHLWYFNFHVKRSCQQCCEVPDLLWSVFQPSALIANFIKKKAAIQGSINHFVYTEQRCLLTFLIVHGGGEPPRKVYPYLGFRPQQWIKLLSMLIKLLVLNSVYKERRYFRNETTTAVECKLYA